MALQSSSWKGPGFKHFLWGKLASPPLTINKGEKTDSTLYIRHTGILTIFHIMFQLFIKQFLYLSSLLHLKIFTFSKRSAMNGFTSQLSSHQPPRYHSRCLRRVSFATVASRRCDRSLYLLQIFRRQFLERCWITGWKCIINLYVYIKIINIFIYILYVYNYIHLYLFSPVQTRTLYNLSRFFSSKLS